MGKLKYKIIPTDKIIGYKCELCNGTLIGTEKKDPRYNYISHKGKVLKICAICLEKLE